MTTLITAARARKAALACLASGAVVGGLLTGAGAASAAPDGDSQLTRLTERMSFKDGNYIVLLRRPSATQYDGRDDRFPATRARGGEPFDSSTGPVSAYTDHLRATHRRLAREVGATVVRDYTMAVNGFAAELTGDQARELTADKRVLLVERDKRLQLDTWASPEFLGMTGRKGSWARHGGKKNAGAGTVVGILDTGIWPESESFAGSRLTVTRKSKWDIHRVGENTFMDKRDGTRFAGVCQTGEAFSANDCNTKLIGARYYQDIYEAGVPEADRSPDEYMSARDGDGHGTHTASTAAGNYGVRARTEGRDFGNISGMAPAARVAAYKVCFSDNDEGTGDCFGSASVAAIDDAISDGVDVINYSIGGSSDTTVDPVQLAFEGAAEAGIFVATSAGNAGPEAGTVNHPSPWLTTVAASTHTVFESTVVLGNGRKVVGASIADEPVRSSPLIDSKDAALPEVDVEDAELCDTETLDPARVTGKIVVCTRGVTGRVDKSAEVARAGGVAMILANPSPDSTNADFHSVPTIHVDGPGSQTIWDYVDARGDDATASFRLGNRTRVKTQVPQIAGFSSRGPSPANSSDILKPDISAPGQNVLAAVAPPTNSNRRFDLYSGTSMASPHIAGLGAFIAGQRPNWTPMQIKSAMMTTAKSLVNRNGKPSRNTLAQGAGNVRPKGFFNPGLFVTSTPKQWRGLLAHEGFDSGLTPVTLVPPVAPKDVNQPSMAQGQVAGSATFTRQFRSTMKGAWKVRINVPGFEATTSSKRVVSDRRGDVEDLTITFTRTDAPIGAFATGYVRLAGPTKLRLPVALRPVSVEAPAEVQGEGTTGSAAVDIVPGFTGDLVVEEFGLAEATRAEDTVEATSAGYYVDYCVTVTDDTKVLRGELDALVDGNGDYLDLYVYSVEGDCATGSLDQQIADAATGSGDETFTWADPPAGSYVLSVELFEPPAGESSVDFIFDVFDVNSSTVLGGFAAQPNPVPVIAGQETSFDAVWSGLDADSRYLGVFEYEGAIGPTYVSVDTTQQGP